MYVYNFVLAIFLGALIGFQREYDQHHVHLKRFAGFRTFILITFLGAILGYLGGAVNSVLVLIGFIGVILLSILSYALTYTKTKFSSATTEVTAIMSYVLGVMCTVGYVELSAIFGIIIVAFLTFKKNLHGLVKKIKGEELIAIVKFALISFVVLPVLPNKNYSPMDIPGLRDVLVGLNLNVEVLQNLDVFNFYYIWLMVVFIAAINFLGYFLVKIIGSKKGYLILGFIGGLASSTAVTLGMSSQSKKNKFIRPFVLATVIAMSVMFVRVIFEIAIVHDGLLKVLIFPLGVMALFGFIFAFVFHRKNKKSKSSSRVVELKQPFAITPALKFGLLFLLVLFLSRLAQLVLGKIGIYGTSILSGAMDVDAITLSLASLSKSGAIDNYVASVGIILAVASNVLVKAGMAMMFGSKKFGRIILVASVMLLLVGLVVLLL